MWILNSFRYLIMLLESCCLHELVTWFEVQHHWVVSVVAGFWGWSFCLLLVTFCSLLVPFACYFLLVTFCSLLITFWLLLITFCSLLFARSSLLFACCLLFFSQNYCEIKLLRAAKKWLDYNETPPQIFSLQISELFVTFLDGLVSKLSQHAKPFSKVT